MDLCLPVTVGGLFWKSAGLRGLDPAPHLAMTQWQGPQGLSTCAQLWPGQA